MKAARGHKAITKKQEAMKGRRFWLVMGCALVIIVWLFLYILAFKAFSALLNQVLTNTDPTSYTYDVVHIIGTPLTLLISALLAVPLAYVIFRRLHLHRPLIDAIGLMLSLVFALSLFTLLFDIAPFVYDAHGFVILAILATIVFLSVLTYGMILRFAVKQIPATVALIAMVLLPLVVITIHVLYRLSLTPLL